MDRFDVVHTEADGAFEFTLALAPETGAPDWDMTDAEREQFIQDVEDWKILYFVARVTCSVAGVEVATEHLGRCAYASVADFIQSLLCCGQRLKRVHSTRAIGSTARS